MVTARDADPLGVAYPRSVEQVSAILKICDAHRQIVVPQGGLTGLAGGATPVGRCLLLSLERMARVVELDPAAATLTVEAGVTLQAVQEAADAGGFLFPLDIGGRGSCQIGGNVSTNAGGNRVLRFGMARELVLGIEAVLPDGTIISALNKMLKNNAGYDLKQLFIGSEGTLGVITRVVLRLYPKPLSVATALCALPDYTCVLQLLHRAKQQLGGTLSAFEAMWPDFYAFATGHLAGPAPLPADGSLHILVETMGIDPARDQGVLEEWIAAAMAAGIVTGAVVAQSEAQTRALWAVRDQSAELKRGFRSHIDFDVSIPVGAIGAFVDTCVGRLKAVWPEVGLAWFGHVADSNIHIAVDTDPQALPRHRGEEIVYAIVGEFGGSISAEHGVGLLKKSYLGHSRSPAELTLMRRIKAAIDPNGILNPGKIF